MNPKSLRTSLLMLMFSLVVIVSCKKDIREDHTAPVPGDPFGIPAAAPVTGSVSGLVVNENNIPVSGAAVQLGTSTATTNDQGLFSFNNLTLDKYITTVTINQPGYFKAYRSFSANATRNYLSVKLIPKTIAGSFNSSAGETVALSNGSSLTFQPNSLVIKSTGAAYNGTVNVYASYIDPTASDILATVPGSFIGSDGNNIYSLQSTGMIAVDLESDGGVPLQLAANLPAGMKLPIPASLLSQAPTAIDTWSLDERGVWKKEGTATKTGNFYETQVTHFSFWNYDAPCNAVYLTLHVQDQNGNALPNTLVQLTIPNSSTWWATTGGFTDSLGNVSGLVPAGMELEMNIYSGPYNCQTPVNTQTIGPFTANTSLTVTATLDQSNLLTISGTATDCTGSPLQNGTAVIYTDQASYYYATIENGTYNATVMQCSPVDSLYITVMDNSNSNIGSSGYIVISGTNVIIPAISACGSSQGAVFELGNGGSCPVINYIGTYTEGVALTGNNVISLMVNVLTPGNYYIGTTLTNGFSFSGSGVFTIVGQQTVFLTGSGTPISAGASTFQTQAMGMPGCFFMINVNGPQLPPAVFDLGPLGMCPNITIGGTYTAGVAMNVDNTVTLPVIVTSPGTYEIFTITTNGVHFVDSGTITVTGANTIVLHGVGMPINPGNEMYTIQTNTGTAGCTFTITTQANSGLAAFTFNGAPGSCTTAIVNGPFIAGTPLTGQSTVTIGVNVTTAGIYSISTNSSNGIVFTAQGEFLTTGSQNVTLIGNGTPNIASNTTFQPIGNNVTGCVFAVMIN